MKNLRNYNILEKIDETVGSEVYRAKEHNTDKTVVIKVLKNARVSAFETARFKQEFERIKEINCHGVIQPYDLFQYLGRLVVVLEDFRGISLDQIIYNKPVSLDIFLEIAISLSKTIGHLHQENIVHMDIKPRNILINPENHELKITDFGIFAQITRENEEIYNPDIIKNTLAYGSPEQSGRMNRQVDYRTDLYSMGVIFYEMLTGRLPFVSDDPMEIIHSHMAKKPIPPVHLNQDIPRVVSHIILKLMAKSPEERYQNSFGLMADLEHCRELKTKDGIVSFKLGTKDISLKFVIPQKLHGRDREISQLENGFYEASQGHTSIIFVSGYSGIGKTALIQEFYKTIVERKGYFVSGKYEQIRQDEPYSGIIKAFQGLMKQILCENRETVEGWKQKLYKALTPNEAIIAQMIPEVAYLIGSQAEITELGSEEFKNRFNLVFKSFIKVFAQKAHPLVLFLDDFQWADLSSLQLFRSLATDPNMAYLLIIASYRDNEVSYDHPFGILMDDLKKMDVRFEAIELKPLEKQDVNCYILDFLRCSEDRSQALANLVHKKTGGNPFFIGQFMKNLHDLKLIQADTNIGWYWDLDQLKTLQLTENVVELLSDKIVQLPESMFDMLKIGACIGSSFSLEMLSAILGKSMELIWEDVKVAINEGYIEFHGDELHFQHDRIREVAYHLISEEKRKKIHYQIGHYALETTKTDQYAGQVFFITDHLNHAKSLILGPEEKHNIAHLNLLSGEKALNSAAYASAQTYFEYGISFLNENAWSEQYQLSLKLYSGCVAAACLDGRFDVMEKHCDIALPQCRNILDQVLFYEFKILAHTSQNNLKEAVKTGLAILKLLDITFPEKPNKLHVLYSFIHVKLALRGKTFEDLLNLPEMTDPRILYAGRIFAILVSPVFQSNPDLYILMQLKHLLLSLKYGNTPVSAVAYSSYGVLLCAILEDFDNGYKFGTLSYNLLEKFNDTEFKTQIIQTFNGFIRHWKDDVKETVIPLLEGYLIAKETGKLEFGAFCLFLYGSHAFLAGRDLTHLDEDLIKHMQAVHQMNQEVALNYLKINRQVFLNLRGASGDPTSITGEAYNEEEMLPIHYKVNDYATLSLFYCHKMFLNFHFGNFEEAWVNTKQTKKYFSGMLSTLNVPRYYFFSALIALSLYPMANALKKRMLLRTVATSRKKLKKYALHSPGNSEFAFFLVTAEHAGVLGDYGKAITFYEKAIESSQRYGIIKNEAICNELAAKFYLSRGHIKTARYYMQDAWYAYNQWGAIAKNRHLETLYPKLVPVSGGKASGNIKHRIAKSLPVPDSAHHLDVITLIKSSEAIFGELVLSKLLKRLMGILIENAGAEKGAIILKENNALLVEAEGKIGSETIDVLKSIPIDCHEGLSSAIVSYAAKVKKNVILHNAAFQGEFVRDPYVVKNKPKSILCMPILNQGRLSAILYLENNLVTNAFTLERLQILNMLSSQLAVSIDNAKLYENLEQKVEERTTQLKAAQAENLKKAHRAGMADIAKETLHNLGNILNSVKTVVDIEILSKNKSALIGLSSANTLLKKHMDHLEAFITQDPKGKKLMKYYMTLEDLFKNEKIDTESQLKRLREKVNETINAVNNLGTYIGSDDEYMEYVRLKEEIQFVLESKKDGLASQNITITEQYNDFPVIRVQKSKFAHILDSLIVNAREAMENTMEQEKNIHIKVCRSGEKVHLHIRDTGEGISTENIKKIFFYGFTTKHGRGGHSLHNCANNMTEMGGKIAAESQGRGKGATFTLEFPVSSGHQITTR